MNDHGINWLISEIGAKIVYISMNNGIEKSNIPRILLWWDVAGGCYIFHRQHWMHALNATCVIDTEAAAFDVQTRQEAVWRAETLARIDVPLAINAKESETI